MIEQLTTVLAAHLDLEWEVAHKLDNLSHMIIVLREQLSLTLRIKQILCGQQLEDLQKTISLCPHKFKVESRNLQRRQRSIHQPECPSPSFRQLPRGPDIAASEYPQCNASSKA
jgi:hypothetical protein